MKRVKIAELKNQLSRYLRAVERGAEIEVTDRERPIARIIPVAADAGVDIVPASRSFASLRRRRYPSARLRRSSLELLREERRNR
jgi:prevent-host-death family protein